LDGEIIAFDDAAQQGTIETPDGQRYAFGLTDWRGRGLPGPGIAVRFDPRGQRASQVLNRPEPQRRARPCPPTATPDAASPRHANAAIAAVVVAILGLFFDVLAPLFGAVAVLFALFGLYQIRRSPERYRGRLFCWVAIALAAVVTLLSGLLATAPASPASAHVNVMPGETAGWQSSAIASRSSQG